jgi:hypothetical protein
VSWYFGRHPFKLQADYFRLFENGDPSVGSDMFRIQLQASL